MIMLSKINSKYKIVIAFVILCTTLQAQKFYVLPSLTFAAGKTKQVVGNGFGLEIGNVKGFYYGARARTFLSLDYLTNANNRELKHSYNNDYDTTHYQLVNFLTGTIGYGIDFSPIKTGKVNVYYGADLIAGFIRGKTQVKVDYFYPFENDYTYNNNISSFYLGVRGRIGVEYPFKKSAVGLEVSRTINVSKDIYYFENKTIGFHGKLNISLLFRW